MAPPVRRSAAPGRHVYDVVVVGGQLSGIITTALLAKHGMQVLHVPHDGLSEPYGEMKLPHAPLLLPPLKSVPAFEEVMTELGLTNVLGRQTHTAPLQLLESDNWFELTHDEKRRGPELARALGDGAEVFDELVRSAEHAANASDAFFVSKPDFPPEGLLARWKFKRSLTRFPALDTDTPLPQSALLRRLVPFIGTNESALSRARVLGRVLTGPALFPGGREGLWQALAERARELGAQVLAGDEPVQRITPESGGVTVRLVHHDVNYRAGFVAAAMDLDVLTALITEKQQKAAAKIVGNVTAARALFVLNLVLPEKALPRGLGTLALLHAPSLEGGAALLSVLPAVNADQRVLSVCTPAPLALRSG